ALIRNRLFEFVSKNSIESDIQKGFWSNISGSVEHLETLTNIMRHSKRKQRQLVVTLLDLKNAFGEVHHNLLPSVLRSHHVPDACIELISELYKDFTVSIASNDFVTMPIPVERGVLQGDSLSPLLFNLCVNTIINTIKDEKLGCMGYVYDGCLRPRNWMQFADHTAIITASEEDNQLLCNAVRKWASWADLIVRVDKCSTFGIKKSATASMQYKPCLRLGHERIPAVEAGCSLKYLGKLFSFEMDCADIKTSLKETVLQYILKIDKLPLHPIYKLKLVQIYVFSKIRWQFTIYDLSESWVKAAIDDEILSKFMRKWLHLPVSAQSVYFGTKVSVRRILRCSKSPEVRRLYEITENRYVIADSIVNKATVNPVADAHQAKQKCDALVSLHDKSAVWNKFIKLEEQNSIISFILSVCRPGDIKRWQSVVSKLPTNIYRFVRRGLVLSLSNASNRRRWRSGESGECGLCKKLQTQLYALNYCVPALDRFTWRHDSILATITQYLLPQLSSGDKLFVDSIDQKFPNPATLFQNFKPDIVIQRAIETIAIELTCPYETNLLKSREFKQNRYRSLASNLVNPVKSFRLVLLEVSPLGFISTRDPDFTQLFDMMNCNTERLLRKCTEVGIRCSYYIYCCRDKCWSAPDLLRFV
ncbi:MAG: hypothetical protein KC777_29900, partial [Cyanobacteria bacterium HKST-UBA02]|nr:hypothetical protein [Cyanobacteria bacterium HKST-UBA02]